LAKGDGWLSPLGGPAAPERTCMRVRMAKGGWVSRRSLRKKGGKTVGEGVEWVAEREN